MDLFTPQFTVIPYEIDGGISLYPSRAVLEHGGSTLSAGIPPETWLNLA